MPGQAAMARGKANPRRAIAQGLERVGLQRPAYRAFEWGRTLPALSETLTPGSRRGADGLPLPPPILRVRVTGTARPDEFLAQGQRSADTVRDVVESSGRRFEALGSVLDFGCGCGRVMRRWVDVKGPVFYGSDYNPDLIAWSAANLPFASFTTNGLAPPLPYGDGQFDLIYALSVFTHLTVDLQHSWMAELRRVLKPGGLLLFTTRGTSWEFKLDDDERRRYDAGEVIVRYSHVAGTNLCSTLHPWSYVHERLSEGFSVLESLPARLSDGRQDVHVLERS